MRVDDIQIWSDVMCAPGATALGRLTSAVTGAVERESLEGEHWLDLTVRRTSETEALLTVGRVLVVTDSTGAVTEWDVERRQATTMVGVSPLLRVRCTSPLYRLARYPVVQVDGDGFVYHRWGLVGVSYTEALTRILAKAPSYWSVGTVTPTTLLDIAFDQDNALSAARKIEAASDVELEVERNGVAGWLLHLRSRGAAAPYRVVRSAHSLRHVQYDDGEMPVTLLQGVGSEGDDGPATIAWAFWRVAAVSGFDVTLESIHGGRSPIHFVNQGTDYRVPTQLPNPDPAGASPVNTPVLTRDVFTSLLAGYTLHRIRDDDSGLFEYYSWSVTPTVGGDLGVYAIVRKDTTPPATFSALEWLDQTAGGVYRGALRIAFDGAGVPTVTPLNGATHAGFAHLGDGVYQVWCRLTGVVAGNELRFRVVPAADGAAATGNLQYADSVIGVTAAIPAIRRPWYLEKRDGTRAPVVATTTAGVVTIGHAATVSVGDYVRFVANGAGEHLTTLEGPLRATLGDRRGTLASPWDDTWTPLPNNIARDFPSSPGKPTGWGGLNATRISRTSEPNDVLTGPYACRYNQSLGDLDVVASITRTNLLIRARKPWWSVMAWIRPLFLAGELELYLSINAAVVARKTYRSPINVWIPLRMDGVDLTAYVGSLVTAEVGLRVRGAGSYHVIVDSFLLAPSLTNRPIVEGAAAARTWEAINLRLDELAQHNRQVTIDSTGLDDVTVGQTLWLDDETAEGPLAVRVVTAVRDRGLGRLTSVEAASRVNRLRDRLLDPTELVVPYFEPVHVAAAVRDRDLTGLDFKASITATTATTVTVQVTASDPLARQVTVVYAAFNATYVSGSGLGPYVFTRPEPRTGIGRIVFTATMAGLPPVVDAVDVPEQDGVYRPTIREQITETDTQGTLTVVIADDPETRVTGVEFATQQGNAAMSGFTLDSSPPYVQSVTFVEKQPSKIAYRVIGKNSAGTTGQVLAEAVVTLKPANKPAMPNLNADCSSKSGDVVLRIEGDADTLSLRYAYSTSAMPSDGAVDAATAVNGRSLSATLTTVLATIDATLYVKARAYSGTSGSGVGSEYAQLTIRRDSKDFDKWLVIHFAAFLPQHYDDWGVGAAGLGLTAEGVDRYAYAPVVLPPGAVIKELHFHGWRQTGTATAEIKLQKLFGSALVDAVTDVATATIASGDNVYYQTVSVTGLSETVPTSGDMRYGLQLKGHRTAAPGVGVGQVKLKYNSPGYEVTL